MGQSALLIGSGTGNFEVLDAQQSGIQVMGEARGLVIVDMNQDGRADIGIARSGESVLLLLNQSTSCGFSVLLEKNTVLLAGAIVTVHHKNGPFETAEVFCGSGYLSLSEPKLFFGYADGNEPTLITILGSDGSTSEANWKESSNLIVRSGEVAKAFQ